MNFKLGDWIHSSSGVGPVVKMEDGVPWIPAGGPPGYGFPAYDARLATEKEIDAAKQGRYFTDPDATATVR